MPEKRTIERARKAKRERLAPSTQAGEFVHEEIEHIREGKHGARSTEQAIAIGLSKARRAGVDLPAPAKGTASAETRKRAKRDLAKGRKSARKRTSAKRSRAMKRRLQREGTSAASKKSLARHARKAASRRSKAARRASAMKGVHKRSHAERSASAKKAARTRARKRAARRH
jgi:hypothetical protein